MLVTGFNAVQETRRTNHCMLGFVMLALEVEIMWNDMFTTFVDSCEVDLHVEFTPSLFLNAERWALESCVESVD